MRILIFGATGGTGSHLVEQALEFGHSVTAFVREASRLRLRHASLRHVVGDAMDPLAVDSAMVGQGAVLCALGTMPESKADRTRRQPWIPLCSQGTKNIVLAMSSQGVRRIIVESSASVGESRRTGGFAAALIVRLALRAVMNDKERQEAIVRSSALEWTIVRPTRLSDGPRTGRLRSGEDLRWGLRSTASRADVAAFMLSALTDTGTVKRAITLLE